MTDLHEQLRAATARADEAERKLVEQDGEWRTRFSLFKRAEDALRERVALLEAGLRKAEPEHVSIARSADGSGSAFYCSTCSEPEGAPHSPACPFALLTPTAPDGAEEK